VADVLVTLLRVPAPEAGERLQLTPLLEPSLPMVAVNPCVPAACTVVEFGETDTVTAWTVTVADADFDGLAKELAVIVTARLLAGVLAGAL